jgi:hypothetical protein
MILTIGSKGYNVSDWLIREPVYGAWSGRILIEDTADAAAGTAFNIDGLWFGTIRHARTVGQLRTLDVIGGANGLRDNTKARQYSPAPLTSVLSDLCGDTGETAGTETRTYGTWRTRGAQLVTELSRLSKTWRTLPTGEVVLTFEGEEVTPPGSFLRANGESATYECQTPTPLAGHTLEGSIVDVAMYSRGDAQPIVTVWPQLAVIQPDPGIISGTVTSLLGGRCSIDLDNGETLSDIPLFCAAGFVPEGASQVRVLVLDVGDDARSTIAITGVDGQIDALTLARAHEAGTIIRSNDKVMISGLVSGAPGAPVTSPPMAVTMSLDPIYANLPPGAPGIGPSRVKSG